MLRKIMLVREDGVKDRGDKEVIISFIQLNIMITERNA